MKPINELIAGLFGTGSCAVGTALQTNEVLQTISLIITILGGIVTLIVLPLLNWYYKAKQDGWSHFPLYHRIYQVCPL